MASRTPPQRTLKTNEFHVLVALADEPLHGYEMAQRMEDDSEGRVRMMPGNLYAILQRLADEGLIQPAASPRGPDDDSRRRYYELTPAGRRALASEGLRLERLASRLRSRRLLEPGLLDTGLLDAGSPGAEGEEGEETTS